MNIKVIKAYITYCGIYVISLDGEQYSCLIMIIEGICQFLVTRKLSCADVFSCDIWGILCDKNCTKTERIKRWRHKGIFFAHAPQPLTCYFHFLFTSRILAYGPFFLPLTSKCHLRRWVLWWNRLNRCVLYAKWHYFLLFFHKSQFDHSFCVS